MEGHFPSFQELRELARSLHAATWAQTDDPAEARRLLNEHLHSVGSAELFELALDAGGATQIALTTETAALARWPSYGLPHVVIGPQRTAEFSLTRCTRETVEGLSSPWESFYVSLPPGLETQGREGPETLVRLCVLCYPVLEGEPAQVHHGCEPGTPLWSWVATTASGLQLSRGGLRPEDLISHYDETDKSGALDLDLDEMDTRTMQCIDRLVVGLCLYLADPEIVEAARKRATGRSAKKAGKRFPAGLSSYVLSDAVGVDARGVLSEYIRGGGRSPTVRSYVRPHWQRYRVGQGRAEIRHVHKSGFFRGPKGATMHAHKIRVPEPRS